MLHVAWAAPDCMQLLLGLIAPGTATRLHSRREEGQFGVSSAWRLRCSTAQAAPHSTTHGSGSAGSCSFRSI